MIAMQYKIVLPSDYSMVSIENRIKEKGHLLNGYPGLVYKAYLYSRKDAKNYNNLVNSYSPFYIWEDHLSMMKFLQSDGFKALCEQFGRPKIETWFVDGRVSKPTAKHKLALIQERSNKNADVAAVNFDSWGTLSVTWCEDSVECTKFDGSVYAIGYVTTL